MFSCFPARLQPDGPVTNTFLPETVINLSRSQQWQKGHINLPQGGFLTCQGLLYDNYNQRWASFTCE